MLRVLRDTDSTLKKPWLVDGTPTSGQTITATVKDLDDVTIASGSAPEDGSTGSYAFTLQETHVPNVALYNVTWANANGQQVTDQIEVVGNWLFSEPQARAFKAQALGNATKYPDPILLAERDRITDLIDKLTGRSWIPRYRRFVLKGSGSRELWLGDAVYSIGGNIAGESSGRRDLQAVLSCKVNGATVSPANISIDRQMGVLHRTDAAWAIPSSTAPFNVTVDLEYGLPEVMDGVDHVALLLLTDRLVNSNIPDRARSWTDEFGNINLDTMPTVARDWLVEHDHRIGIA